MKSKKDVRWENVTGQFKTHAKKYYLPETIEDIVSAIREAEVAGIKIRAVGSGHSFNDCAITNGILLDMKKLSHVEKTSLADKKPEAANMTIVSVLAGINIKDLNRDLDNLGLAMPVLGAINNQTISGALATGTHGGSPYIPPLPGAIRSVLLVAAEGNKFRIEPFEGITDPAKHNEPGVRLIQDDDTFNSLTIHLGAFGVIYSMVIEVKPQYWLCENKSVEKWSALKNLVINGKIFDPYTIKLEHEEITLPVYAMNIFINPYEFEGDHSCIVGRVFQLPEKPHRSILDASRNILANIAAATLIPYSRLVHAVNNNPESVPKMIEMGIHSMRDKTYAAESYHVWLQGMEYLAMKGFGSEFAYQAESNDWLNIVQTVFDKYKSLKEEGLYTPGPPMVRFSAGSKSFLDPTNGKRTVWIGTPTLIEYHRSQEMLDIFQEMHYALGGRVHWGKMNNKIADHPGMLEEWYPKLPEWKKQMKKFNTKGSFNNDFTDRLGLTNNG